jgi:hypothetical protein
MLSAIESFRASVARQRRGRNQCPRISMKVRKVSGGAKKIDSQKFCPLHPEDRIIWPSIM